jgi:hypothetical protein
MTPDSPRSKLSTAWLAAVIVLVLAVAWWAAFWLTGLLWWGAPADAGQRVPPPVPAQLRDAQAPWVDLDLYQRSHPRWQP